MKKTIPFNSCEFDLNYLVGFELFGTEGDYIPLVISVNYTHKGK